MSGDDVARRFPLLVRVVRATVGLALGYFCCSLTLLAWLIALTAYYGDMARGLELVWREPWAEIAIAAAASSSLAAWAGAFGGGAAFGDCRARRRRTVFTPIALGAAVAAVGAAPVGAANAWLVLTRDPASDHAVLAAIASALPVGFACGVVVGRHLTHSPTLVGRWRRVPGRPTLYRDDTPAPRGRP